jgi:LysM repeat protein
MKFFVNKFFIGITGISALMLLNTGCITNPQEQRSMMQQQQEDSLILQEDLRRIRARLESLEQDMQRMVQQVNATTADQTRGTQSQMQGMNAILDDLQKKIRAVDAARENDKKEIVDTLTKKISQVLGSSQSSRSSSSSSAPKRQISSEGYEHEVQPGETLSAIAKAYGASSADIIQANGLKSGDMLRVGQKLFIPSK